MVDWLEKLYTVFIFSGKCLFILFIECRHFDDAHYLFLFGTARSVVVACFSLSKFWFHSVFVFRQQYFAKFYVMNWSRRYFFIWREKKLYEDIEHLKRACWLFCLMYVRCTAPLRIPNTSSTYEWCAQREGEWTENILSNI